MHQNQQFTDAIEKEVNCKRKPPKLLWINNFQIQDLIEKTLNRKKNSKLVDDKYRTYLLTTYQVVNQTTILTSNQRRKDFKHVGSNELFTNRMII